MVEKGYITTPKFTADQHVKQIIVEDRIDVVKVEINHVLRGCVNPCVQRTLTAKANTIFKKFTTIQCLSENDLFAGKLCAALDRQHPRDLYDMNYFLEHRNYARDLHEAFLVYLISNNRPISELIKPNQQDLSHLYTLEFTGMTETNMSLDDLYQTFSRVVALTYTSMTNDDKEFLISFKAGAPKWSLLPFGHLKTLPAIKWKLHNIQKMDSEKHKQMLKRLEAKLS